MENFLEIAFNSTSSGIIFWNEEGKIISINNSAKNHTSLNDLDNVLKFLSQFDKNLNESIKFKKENFVLFQPEKSLKYVTQVLGVHSDKIIFQTITTSFENSSKDLNQKELDILIDDLRNQKRFLTDRESNLKLQNAVLLQLAKSSIFDHGDLDNALKKITSAATVTLDCDRSSVWFFNENKTNLQQAILFDKNSYEYEDGKVLNLKDYPNYFNALYQERIISVKDAHTDSSTSEFSENYLAPLNIYSLLDAPIRVEGKMIGVICNETVGYKKNWSLEEEAFASSLADLITRTLDSRDRNLAKEELKKANEELEQRVIERTKELQEKMNEVVKLKKQQDGDYFLTTLILNPLCIDLNSSKILKTEYYVEQKKQFEFHNNTHGLGGDIIICGNLKFWEANSKFLFFINADAMGKSMQGAGGAIVLGSVMNNILANSARKNKVLQISPEEWLQQTYVELHSVFLAFYGTMLISACFGLINEKTGEMFYLNAEHPPIILYRDGIAEFTHEETNLQKLGSDFAKKNKPEIKKFLLMKNDILFIGSDGKDDLLIYDKNNKKEMSNDISIFLNIVKSSNGKLNLIVSELKKTGELTDDLSILKIEFFSNEIIDT